MAGYTKAIGIDLGLTKSCVGVFRNGRVEIICSALGNKRIPSMVSFTNTERYIGESARVLIIQNPTNTVYGVKRLIGLKYDESLQKDLEMLPFRVIHDWSKLKIAVTFKNKETTFTPQEISAMILSKLKETAEAYLEHEVKEAVITVPAYFDDTQRKATMEAAKIAGLKVLLILNEPTAAAIAYGLDKGISVERNILVYDFGAETFDVSIMTVKDGIFKLRAVAGDAHLGGENITSRLLEHLTNDFKHKFQKDISVNKKALARLNIHCREVKLLLSSLQIARIDIGSLMDGINYSATIDRACFEQINADLFMNTMKHVQQALYYAKMAPSDIQNVVLVGGSTRIPKVQSLLKELFGDKKLCKSIDQDEVVAYGAAIQAAMLKGDTCESLRGLQLNDVTPFTLGIDIGIGNTHMDDQSGLPKEDTAQMQIQKEHKYKPSDDLQKCAVTKANLEDYICNIESKITDNFRNNIAEADKEKILNLCKTISAWLAVDEPREIEDYVTKQMQLEQMCIPILRK